MRISDRYHHLITNSDTCSSLFIAIPPTSAYAAIILSSIAVATIIAKHFFIPRRYWGYVPNWNAIGLGFVVPQVYYPLIMAVAATITWFWGHRSPRSFDLYGFPLAAGLVAGEGIGGVMTAILTVVGVGGAKYGTAIGCPSLEFCG